MRKAVVLGAVIALIGAAGGTSVSVAAERAPAATVQTDGPNARASKLGSVIRTIVRETKRRLSRRKNEIRRNVRDPRWRRQQALKIVRRLAIGEATERALRELNTRRKRSRVYSCLGAAAAQGAFEGSTPDAAYKAAVKWFSHCIYVIARYDDHPH